MQSYEPLHLRLYAARQSSGARRAAERGEMDAATLHIALRQAAAMEAVAAYMERTFPATLASFAPAPTDAGAPELRGTIYAPRIGVELDVFSCANCVVVTNNNGWRVELPLGEGMK